jgi:hypothetical protein
VFRPRVAYERLEYARFRDLVEIEIKSKTTDLPTFLTSLSEASGEGLVLVNPSPDHTCKWATWTTG